MIFLAPTAERQRSFSNSDSSVVVVHPSSTFQLKAWFLKNCLITFFLFWHVASLGWYQCIVKIWIWLNHPKGHFERSNLAHFLLGGNFLKNFLITFSLFMQEAFKVQKVWKRSNFAVFATFCQFTQKRSDNFSLFLVYSFFGM